MQMTSCLFLVLLSLLPAAAIGLVLMGINLGRWFLPHGPFSWVHMHSMWEALNSFLDPQYFLWLALSPGLWASRFLDFHAHSDPRVLSHQRWDLGCEVCYIRKHSYPQPPHSTPTPQKAKSHPYKMVPPRWHTVTFVTKENNKLLMLKHVYSPLHSKGT